ncbi:hypothetical protein FN846DRAFT_975260 [Sphaerosporella brunnea]|uniref:USP domain-containing protein n=1 Tax=Sphaerosporella brunnea TaxID=1250544 RepID=A0A5J5EHP5_9PEZI|nr:hypothetical protein FN846DRAFT_975260 [Sphaerosporella brunnea]
MTSVSRPTTPKRAFKSPHPTPTTPIAGPTPSTLSAIIRGNINFVAVSSIKGIHTNDDSSADMLDGILRVQANNARDSSKTGIAIADKHDSPRSISSSPEYSLSRSSSTVSAISTAPTTPPSSAPDSDAGSVGNCSRESSPKKRKYAEAELDPELLYLKSPRKSRKSESTGLVTQTTQTTKSDIEMENTVKPPVTEGSKVEQETDTEMGNTDKSAVITLTTESDIQMETTAKPVVTEGFKVAQKTANDVHVAAKHSSSKERQSAEAGLDEGPDGEKRVVSGPRDAKIGEGDAIEEEEEEEEEDEGSWPPPKVARRETPLETPEEWRGPRKVRGLPNRSVMCYRNAVIQFLSASDAFMLELNAHRKECKIKRHDCVACNLALLYSEHFRKPGQNYRLNSAAESILASFKKLLPAPFNRTSNQEDAHEYFTVLMGAISNQHDHLPEDEKHHHPVYHAFTGSYPNLVKCPKCHYVSRTGYHQPCLILESFNPRTDRAAIRVIPKLCQMFQPLIVDWNCPKCFPKKKGESKVNDTEKEKQAKERKGEKKHVISDAPPFLVINIPRHRVQDQWFVKTRTKAVFPPTLSMPDDEGKAKARYKLKAVIAHWGSSLNSGHYIAYVRKSDTTWTKCDDEQITEVNWDVVKSCDNNNFQACVLGYEKME